MKAAEIQERRKQITELIFEKESVNVKDLVARFNVSDETIRNDLSYLAEQGILKKVYGGAVLIANEPLEPVLDRTTIAYQKKLAIAEKALTCIPQSATILGLDHGSTVAVLANLLKKTSNKTIFTSSLAAILELIKSGNTLYSFGGKYSDEDMSFQSELGFDTYPDVHMDICFFGSSGVQNRNGFCTSSFVDAELKRKLMKKSTKKIVLLDSSKFQHSSLVEVAPWQAVDLVISNQDIDPSYRDLIASQTELWTV